MKFDADRQGTGTKEWAEVTENICRGCANNCLYCYAAHNANRFGLRKREDWAREELTKRSLIKSYSAKDGVVMFPSSHDITPFNLEACIRVMTLILKKGNKVLIVTKPRAACIEAILEDLAPWKEQILFRFTIGSMNDATCFFWEPGAPSPQERLGCLKDSFEAGFRTSVSIEPMLAGVDSTLDVVGHVDDFVTETIWIGKMNKVRLRVDKSLQVEIANVEKLQSDDEILRLHKYLNAHPLVRWKDSIKEVIARAL